MNKNTCNLVDQARRLLSQAVLNVDRNVRLLTIFDHRYITPLNKDGFVEGLSIKDIAEITGDDAPLIRADIKAIWRFIGKNSDFINESIAKVYKAAQKEKPFSICLTDVSIRVGLNEGYFLFLKDLVKSEYLKVKDPRDRVNLFIIKRGGDYYLSSTRKMVAKSKDNTLLARQEKMSGIVQTIKAESEKEDPFNIANNLSSLCNLIGRNGEILMSRLGLNDGTPHSLQESGAFAGGITRERVRQVCLTSISMIKEAEKRLIEGPVSILHDTLTKVSKRLNLVGAKVEPLTEIIEREPSLVGFTDNEKGLYLLAKMIGVKNISRINGFWIVAGGLTPAKIKTETKQFLVKKAKSLKEKAVVTSTITMIPPSILNKIRKASEDSKSTPEEFISMNDQYVLAVEDFIQKLESKVLDVNNITLDKVDWKDKKNFTMVSVRLEEGVSKKITDIVNTIKESESTERPSFASVLLTAVKLKYGERKTRKISH